MFFYLPRLWHGSWAQHVLLARLGLCYLPTKTATSALAPHIFEIKPLTVFPICQDHRVGLVSLAPKPQTVLPACQAQSMGPGSSMSCPQASYCAPCPSSPQHWHRTHTSQCLDPSMRAKMERQRKNPQRKEKESPEKKLNETEVGNMSEKRIQNTTVPKLAG